MHTTKPLTGRIAVVAGSTRGAGRGIASMLGEAGATVYCTGRSVRGSTSGRPESIDDTAEMVTARGGVGIPVRVDHTDAAQVRALFERVMAEQGRLDVLVNNVNGDDLDEWGKPFWEQTLERGFAMIRRGVDTHIITTHAAIPHMLRNPGPSPTRGLIVGVSDKGSTSFYYGFAKGAVMRMAELLGPELRPHGIAAVAVTPGFLRSEAMLERFGVTEANWRDAVKHDPFFGGSETPFFVGRAVAALAADPKAILKTGKTLASWELADEYGFTDVDGERPHWDRFCAPKIDEKWAQVAKQVRAEFKRRGVDPARVEADRATLTIRVAGAGGAPPVEHTLSWPEVVLGAAKGLAVEVYERYALVVAPAAPAAAPAGPHAYAAPDDRAPRVSTPSAT
jgi:NAD(P)-dependent dehydrogenase (short-subunit alcohol dehydrogenase family)